MFWGLIMESGKRYTQTVERAFHLSMAVLELDPSDDDDSVVSLRLHFDNREFILCHLNKEKKFQAQLDLNFQSGDKIAFLTSGQGRVHLSGYLLETDEDEMDDMDEEDEEDESIPQQMRALLEGTTGKRKSSPKVSKQNKKMKLQEAGDAEDSDEDAEDDEDEDDSEMGSDDETAGIEDEDDDDDDEEDEEESSEEEMMVTSPKQKAPEVKKNKEKVKMSAEKPQPNRSPGDKQQQPNRTPGDKQQQPNRTPGDKQQQPNRTPGNKQQQQQQLKKKTPNEKQQNKIKSPGEKPHTPTSPATPNGLQESGKKKKKGQEKLDTPKSETPQRRTLEGGVMIEDLKVGNGPVAKPGRQVQVYYVGRLKQNNKQFDSSTEGPGFKFRLARGEVIKGWDIGVSGMRVGGKRKIVCPPALAYGSKGVPPSIPPNSALVFEVELKSVN